MLQVFGRLLLWVRGETLRLLLLAIALLLVWGVFSPVGTLVWWLQQSTESLGLKRNDLKRLPGNSSNQTASKIDCYIIFLSGIGDFSANQLTRSEEFLLNRLVQLHPNCVAVSDVFPYSAANEGLGGQRLLAPVWQAIEQSDGWLKEADVLIKIRNLWRFAIAADDRYGPVYHQGIATAIVDRMNAAHPIPYGNGRSLNLILIGTSGGAEVALGAVSYLKQWLNARINVVSVGGVFDGETGFDVVDKVYHLQGKRDWIEDISHIFPACWQWVVGSPFNQAVQQERFTIINSGPHTHDGDEGYFGENIAAPKQTTYVELTLQKVNQLPIWERKAKDRSEPDSSTAPDLGKAGK